ncbi:CAP domain-containing protein [Domibacillus indicus]|uniref:CAP domain-containing protein n=1 Tax=Domibacillus indicus TaxID=1437523 RepID=UPI00203CCC64|nr:CAP domain-containing protein [Domibacillus indicus]MCM3787678.1 CAP domain-containing protein [Domibacillus indicus]
MVIFLIIMLIGIYADKAIDEKGEGPPSLPPVNSGKVDPRLPADVEPAPKEGVGTLVGASQEVLIKKYGEPVRREPSAYGYTWWVYKTSESYMLAGVQNSQVVTIFAKGEMNTSPFLLGRSASEIFRSRYPEAEIVAHANDSYYRFELSEEELNIRPLIPIGDFYAQLYIDQQTGILSGIRFMTADVLLKMKPYELVYEGVLPEVPSPGRSAWVHIERGSEAQLADISQFIRDKEGVPALVWAPELNSAAKSHSQDMFEADYFGHQSPRFGDLKQRLTRAGLFFDQADEMINANYPDAPAAMEAWLNSPDERELLLSDTFTSFGTGAYRTHFTQILTGK